MHIIGPSSSGKTSLGIAMLDDLYKDHYMLGEISPNTFLSGLNRGKQKGKLNSFLHQIGERGLIFAPDFTNFLSNDPLAVGKVAGQLREIYDGRMTKRAGSMDQVNDWQGEVAMVTAFTPSKEHAWHSHNREGERFLTLRWPGVEPRSEEEEVALGRIMKNADKKLSQIELRGLVRKLIELGVESTVPQVLPPGTAPVPRANWEYPTGLTLPSSDNVEDRSYKLARLVGKLRTQPVRGWDRSISHVAGEENPGRVFKQLIKAARGWAGLMRREGILPEDWLLAERLAIDTIPETRRWLLESLPWNGGVTTADMLLEMTPFKGMEGMMWHLADLLALEVVGTNSLGELWLMDEFVRLAESGCRGWVEGLRVGREEKVGKAQERMDSKAFGVMR